MTLLTRLKSLFSRHAEFPTVENVDPFAWTCPYCLQKVAEGEFEEHLSNCEYSLWFTEVEHR